MSGETDLSRLLHEMKPELNEGEYVFCSISAENTAVFTGDRGVEPLGWFREREGLSVILPRQQADGLGLRYSIVCAWITLTIHSSLEAVGMTAAIARALTEAGISCNVVAAYYHDHLFIPLGDATRALSVLQNLASDSVEGD